MTRFQPVIKWSGSKRTQASRLVDLFPDFDQYYEPFLGGGSVLRALIEKRKTKKAVCGDICGPLIDLWLLIQNNPDRLIKSYNRDWLRLKEEGYLVYYEIRDRFNREKSPEDLLFLSRTCVNGLIRFNKSGGFNNSLHHTRRGITPDKLKKIIHRWSAAIQGVVFLCGDYRLTTENASSNDIVYLDPPYFNTKGRYYGAIDYNDFISFLEELNSKNIRFVLSYDGMREETNYLTELPKHLFKRHLFFESGNSSFKKVMDKKPEIVTESVYLNF
jgi:DNA adenine methylase